jgi:16S rRNA processing protein RimM
MKVEYLTIGKIARPHSNRGEVIINIMTDFPSRFFDSSEFLLKIGHNSPETFVVEKVREHKGRIIAKFKGINSINDAETLRNGLIVIPEEERMSKDDDDFFYHYELVGMKVVAVDGRKIGSVREVMEIAGGRDILAVNTKSGEVLIPFVDRFCVEIDRTKQEITVDLPEGLEDINLKKG